MQATKTIPGLSVEFEVSLVEEAVLLAIDRCPTGERSLFRSERDEIYSVREPDRRERQFQKLHNRWFYRLHLEKPVMQALQENPALEAGLMRCIVAPAKSARDLSADLYGRRDGDGDAGRPVLGIGLTARRLIDPVATLFLLRHELGHVADMLDPAFGYTLDLNSTGLPSDKLLRYRYQILWNASVDGRLLAANLLPAEVELLHRKQFAAAFPMLGGSLEAAFQRFFRLPRPSHPELIAFAESPESWLFSRP